MCSPTRFRLTSIKGLSLTAGRRLIGLYGQKSAEKTALKSVTVTKLPKNAGT